MIHITTEEVHTGTLGDLCTEAEQAIRLLDSFGMDQVPREVALRLGVTLKLFTKTAEQFLQSPASRVVIEDQEG